MSFNNNETGNVKFYVEDENEGIDLKYEDGGFTFNKQYSGVFIYGKEVNDLHTVDKAQIFALHHSAIQELSRKNDALNIEKETMQTQITTLLEENNSMKSRLEALEAAIINLQNN